MSFPSYWQITAVCHTIDHWFYVKYFVTCNLIHQILHILHTDYSVFTEHLYCQAQVQPRVSINPQVQTSSYEGQK